MKTERFRKSWRRIAAWTLASTLAFSLLPTVALASTSDEDLGVIESTVIVGEQTEALEIAVPDVNNNAFDSINPLAKKIAKSVIDATKPIGLSANGKKKLSIAAGQTKYYKITMSNPSRLNMKFTSLNLNTNAATAVPSLELYALKTSTGSALEFDRYIDSAYGGKGTISTSWYVPKGTYYLKVDATTASDVFYVTTKTTKYTETIAEPIPGINESYKSARTIALNKSYSGLVATNNGSKIDENDFYRFRISYDTNISIKTSAISGLKGCNYYVYSSSSVVNNTAIASGIIGTSLNMNLNKGTYYINITDYSQPYKGGRYSLNIVKGPKLVVPAATPARLKWGGIPGADSYEIWRSTDNVTFKRFKTVSSSVTHYKLNIAANTTYYFKVRYIDGNLKSPWSDTYKVTRAA